jgi:hypothetical protein
MIKDTNELLELAHEIREAMDATRVNRKIDFVEKSHTYSIYDPIKKEMTSDLPSVSTIIKQYSEPFDNIGKSMKKADGDLELAQEIRDGWAHLGDIASSIGSYVHYKLEQYVWTLFDIDKEVRKPEYNLTPKDLIEAQGMLKSGINLIHTIIENGFVPLDTECVMGSLYLGYFGQCDNLWLGIHKEELVILMSDHKTNKTNNFTVRPWNVPMKEPFQDLVDTTLSEYYVQQPLYAQLFRDMLRDTIFKDIPIIGYRILHLRDGGSSIKIPEWVNEEVSKLYPLESDCVVNK